MFIVLNVTKVVLYLLLLWATIWGPLPWWALPATILHDWDWRMVIPLTRQAADLHKHYADRVFEQQVPKDPRKWS